MNIGIDIDDTITDTYETMLPMIALKYNANLTKLLSKKPSYKMLYNLFPNYHDFVYNNYTTMANIVPLKKDVIDVLTKLKKEGHRIIFITARNNLEYKDPYKTSYDYLRKNKIPFDKLIVNVDNKAKECVKENIDLFIDDSTRNCTLVKKKGIPTLQFTSLINKDCKRFERVNSWQEVYNHIQDMYA